MMSSRATHLPCAVVVQPNLVSQGLGARQQYHHTESIAHTLGLEFV